MRGARKLSRLALLAVFAAVAVLTPPQAHAQAIALDKAAAGAVPAAPGAVAAPAAPAASAAAAAAAPTTPAAVAPAATVAPAAPAAAAVATAPGAAAAATPAIGAAPVAVPAAAAFAVPAAAVPAAAVPTAAAVPAAAVPAAAATPATLGAAPASKLATGATSTAAPAADAITLSRAASSVAAAGATPAATVVAPTAAAPASSNPPLVVSPPITPKAAGKAFRIGCVVPLSGGKANTGRAVKAAVEMAIKEVAPKRLPGYKVDLVCEDSQCLDVPALKAASKLARSANVDVLVGDVCSAASLASTSVANKYQLPMVSAASTATSLSTAGDYFFRTVPSDRYQGQFAAAQMMEQGLKKVVVAYSDGSYGQSLSFSFIAAFTRDGGKAFPVAVPIGSRNITSVLDEIKRVQPDGVFMATNGVLWGADLIKAVKSSPPPLNKVAFFMGDSMMDPTVSKTAGPAVTAGIQGSEVSFGTPEFVAAFREYVKDTNISYTAKAAHAYDAAVALIEAYRRAAEPKDGPQIIAELASVKFDGKSGPISFDEFGDLTYSPAASYDLLEFQPDGQLSVAKKVPGRGPGAAAKAAAAAAAAVPAAAAAVPAAAAAVPAAAAAVPAAAAAAAVPPAAAAAAPVVPTAAVAVPKAVAAPKALAGRRMAF